MSDAIISVEHLGKRYRIRHKQEPRRYVALRDVLASKLAAPFRSFRRNGRPQPEATEDFWALKDVSFEVKPGEVVGIIGRNGAGKSTLLKILSRITEPTEGRVTLEGRVASLLEVGTGFHPELTGRENIFLNGAILGMKRAEIARKFDEIVAFAEVDTFLDVPVKRYSSGMYVRLAFAVAAHIDPEILIVDEVLAVGDAEFQKKCLGKMHDVAHSGRTVLFVSHNMSAVEQLCTSAMLLDRGRVQDSSNDVRRVIRRYLASGQAGAKATEWTNSGEEYANPYFTPLRFDVSNCERFGCDEPFSNDVDIWLQIEGRISDYDPALSIGYALYGEDAQRLYWSFHTDDCEEKWIRLGEGLCRLRTRIPRRLLNQGTYRVELLAALHYRAWLLEPGVRAPAVHFTIQGGLSDSPQYITVRPTLLAPILPWESGESIEQRS